MNKTLNSTPLNTRLAFVASSEPVIDIFDTYCYQKVASVPIRDPIIGPVRASIRPDGQIVLIGATIRGVTPVSYTHLDQVPREGRAADRSPAGECDQAEGSAVHR